MRLIITALVLVVAPGQAIDDAWAAGSRAAAPPGSAAARVGGIALDPAKVAGGTVVKGTVTLMEPAPHGGAVVAISTSDPKVATVPASVMVPAGANAAAFVVQTSDRASQQTTVDIAAQIGNARPAMARLVVTPASGDAGPQAPQAGWDLKQNQKK